jgi:predicted nuclease of restriction endonuclease-like RecB superfamily
MANIFNLSQNWKQIVDMADDLDDQTLADTLEALDGEIGDKVANTIAVIKSVEKDIELAKEYKKTLDDRIKTMNNTVKRLKDYVMLGVDTAGKPKKGAEQFRKLEIKDAPWVKSAWTQYNPPSVKVVDDRLVDPDYLVPQPDKVNTTEIAKRWKEDMAEFEAKKNAKLLELQTQIDENEIQEDDATAELEQWEKDNAPHFSGVEIRQDVGVRFR